MVGELAGRSGPQPDPAAELDLGDDGDPDERRDRGVRARRAEERTLELGVGALEGDVVPIEAATPLGGRDQERDENGAEESLLLGRLRASVRPREDRGGRLAQQLVERDPSVLAGGERTRPRLDERPDERPVLVEGRPVTLQVLLEGERQVVAFLERTAEVDEGAQTEGAQGEVKVRCANRHSGCLLPRR